MIDFNMADYRSVIFVFLLIGYEAKLEKISSPCQVGVRIDSGWICGARRLADDGSEYASYRGIPYAKQPLGVLRFQELQPVTPWKHYLDTTEEGPICPQHDEVFGRLMKPSQGMSEACIYANVHVPLGEHYDSHVGRPILVFIHGGGFQSGSGDADLNGPEYLVSQGVIVITFNYRLNVFGFLSLNSPVIPGNQGLRDQVTLLRWVQRNARVFGGDPENVTLMGQSAGAASAHLLSMSRAARGLFRRAILMSGAANAGFFTTSPLYAQFVATFFLAKIGINPAADPLFIHDQLVKMSLEKILLANSDIQYATGLISFSPVIEAPHPGVTMIVEGDPIELIKRGRGNEYPLIIGFTSAECEYFKPRIIYLRILNRIAANPLSILSPTTVYETPPNVSQQLAQKTIERYFKGILSYDRFMVNCAETLFQYPAFQLADLRTSRKGAPVYLYQYDYNSEYNVIKDTQYLKYNGSAHIEDLVKVLKVNSVLRNEMVPSKDNLMVDWMRKFVVNFMKCSNPSCVVEEARSPWPAVHGDLLNYLLVSEPRVYINTGPTPYQWDMIHYFDNIYADAKRAALESPLTSDLPEVSAMLRNATDQALQLTRPPYYAFIYDKPGRKLL